MHILYVNFTLFILSHHHVFYVQSMCIPSGSPMSAAPDIMTSSTSSLQGLRKSSGLRSKLHSSQLTTLCTELKLLLVTTAFLLKAHCTEARFWKHHSFLSEMHHKPTSQVPQLPVASGLGNLTTKLHNMERTWQNWRRLFSERDDISQSLLSGNHFHRYGDKKHKSHAFLKPNHLHSCHQWISLNLCVLRFNSIPS